MNKHFSLNLFILLAAAVLAGCGLASPFAQQCENAFAAQVVAGSAAPPFQAIKQSGWLDDGWEAVTHPLLAEDAGQDAGSLICIHESRQDTGELYIGGAVVNPYWRIWDIRVVSLSDGSVVAAGNFRGGDPPSSVKSTSSVVNVYGPPPWSDLFGLLGMLKTFAADQRTEAIAFSPDGSRLASAGDPVGDKSDPAGKTTLQMWDLASGEIALDFEDADYLDCLAFSPDGKNLATCHFEEIILWDAATGQQVRTIETEDYVGSLQYSPDGRQLAGDINESMVFWDPGSGSLLRSTVLGPGFGFDYAFSADWSALAVEEDPSATSITLFDPATGSRKGAVETGATSCLALSADGAKLGTSNAVWDVAAALLAQPGQGLATPPAFAGTPVPDAQYVQMLEGWGDKCALSADGALFAVNDSGVWEVSSGEKLFTISDGPADLVDLAFSPDGRWLAVAYGDLDQTGVIQVWDLERLRSLRQGP